MHILLIGSPGSGKGTFAEHHTNHYHLCLGDILRKEMHDQTPLGLECRSYVNAGKLIPTATGIQLFEQHFKIASMQNKFVIVDGMVQNEEYASYFKRFFADKKVIYVYLKASKQLCIERLKSRKVCVKCTKVYSSNSFECCQTPLGKRKDDEDPEACARRVERFFDKGIKLVELFKDCSYIEIDTEQPLEGLKAMYQCIFKRR